MPHCRTKSYLDVVLPSYASACSLSSGKNLLTIYMHVLMWNANLVCFASLLGICVHLNSCLEAGQRKEHAFQWNKCFFSGIMLLPHSEEIYYWEGRGKWQRSHRITTVSRGGCFKRQSLWRGSVAVKVDQNCGSRRLFLSPTFCPSLMLLTAWFSFPLVTTSVVNLEQVLSIMTQFLPLSNAMLVIMVITWLVFTWISK